MNNRKNLYAALMQVLRVFTFILLLIVYCFYSLTVLYATENTDKQIRLKVHLFFDENLNGIKEEAEWGVGGLSVSANDKTCISDVTGTCALEFNKDLVFDIKGYLQKEFLPDQAIVTLNASFEIQNPGAEERVLIGVFYSTENLYLSTAAKLKLRIQSYFAYARVRISGNLLTNKLIINNTELPVPSLKCIHAGPDAVNEGHSNFIFQVIGNRNTKKWKFVVYNEYGEAIYEEIGTKTIPSVIHWNGKDAMGREIFGNTYYSYRLMGIYENFDEIWSALRFIKIAGESIHKIQLTDANLKFSSLVWNKLKQIKEILDENLTSEVILQGKPGEVERVKKILLKELLIAKTRIKEEISVSSRGVLVKLISAPDDPVFSYRQKLEIEGIEYLPLNDGSFNFFIRDVPVHQRMRIDMVSSDGSRIILSAEMPEAGVFKKFSYTKIEKEFSNIEEFKNKFKFLYIVSGGSYAKEYSLYSAEGDLITNRNDLELKFVSEVGKSEFPFELKEGEKQSIPLKYVILSSVINQDASNSLLMLSLPKAYEKMNTPYLFIRGGTNVGNKLLFNGVNTTVNANGEFSYLFNLARPKNRLFAEVVHADKKKFSYELNVNYTKANFLERNKIKIGLSANFYSFKHTEETSNKGYSLSNFTTLQSDIAVFPLYSSVKNGFWCENIGFELSFERPLVPIVVEDSKRDMKETLNGPSWLTTTLLLDLSEYYLNFKSLFKLGYKTYTNKFHDELYKDVGMGASIFAGFEAGYLIIIDNFKTKPSLSINYYYPSDERRGLEMNFHTSTPAGKHSSLDVGFLYKKYSQGTRVTDVFKGVFLGAKLVF